MKKCLFTCIPLLVLFIFHATVKPQEISVARPAQPLSREEASAAIERIGELQKDINAITARAFQKKKTALTEREIDAEGTITLKKPNLLYWEVERPEKVIIVADGKRLWVYHPSLKEVQRYLLSGDMAARSTMEFFSSSMAMTIEKLEKKFEVVVYHPSESYVFELRPRSKIAMKHLSAIYIWYREKDGIPVRFEVIGQKDSRTVTTFNDISINPEIADGLFHFEVPKGVRITNEDENE